MAKWAWVAHDTCVGLARGERMSKRRLVLLLTSLVAIAMLGVALAEIVQPHYLSTITTLIISAAALAAIWKEQIQDWLVHPDLDLRAEFYHHETNRKWHHPTVGRTYSARTYYVLAQVENLGSAPARNVEASVVAVLRRSPDEEEHRHEIMTPINLSWSYRGNPTLEVLPRKTTRSLTIGHVTDPETGGQIGESPHDGKSRFWLELNPVPYSREHGLVPGGFTYEIQIQLTADNTEPKTYRIRLHHTGVWKTDAEKLWPEELHLKNEGRIKG